MPDRSPRLAVDGELTFSVDGPGGATSGTVSGEGSTVRVHAEHPARAWDAALGSVSTGSAVLSFVAEQLHAEGVVLEVTGPAGRVATVGAGVDSPVGRLLAGSRRVQLGRPAAVRPLAVARVRAGLPAPARLLALAAVAGVLISLLRHRRRH